MKYKLIAVDMDGTLLNSNNEVSFRNMEAIEKAKSLGVKVILSTGRLFTSACQYAKKLKLNAPIISCNGAYVTDQDFSSVIYEAAIDRDLAKKIIKVARNENIYYHFYGDEVLYIAKENTSSKFFINWVQKGNLYNGIDFEVLDNPLKEIQNKGFRVYKFIFVEDDKYKLLNFKEKISKLKGLEIASSWWNNIELMGKGVSKGNALKEVCKIFNIDNSEVIAIGDNENDISMFKFAGLAVAMENGNEKAKKSADYVTDSNDNNGVGKVIEKFILSEYK